MINEEATARVDALLRTMTTETLQDLRAALLADKAREQNPVTDAFCDGRIALIDEILKERRTLHSG